MDLTLQRQNIDSVISYLFIRKLVTPIMKTPAYKLELVNNAGKVIKEPVTDEEKMALTLLDRIAFKIKRLLGGKLVTLNQFLYTTTQSIDMYNKVVIRGSIDQRAEIIRIVRDVKKMVESKGCSIEDVVGLLLTEEVEKQELL